MDKLIPYFLLGALFIVIGIVMLINSAKKNNLRRGSTVAIIIDVLEKLDIRTDNAGEARRYRYIPTYSYKVNGRNYMWKGVYAYDNKNKFRIGDTVRIYYDPNNPQDAATDESKGAKNKTGIVFMIIGIGLCVLACTQL